MNPKRIQLIAPDGGWGYVVAVSLSLMCTVTVIPMACFGLIFGRFLSSIGDETTGTTLSNGLFNTCFNITGLAANSLLQRYSYRTVAVAGSVIFFIGSFATIFASTLFQLVLSFGVIQGVGMGLMFPALFTALNCYFDKRLNLINNIAQALMILAQMLFPPLGQFLMDRYGFRGTVAVLSALSLNSIVAAVSLQPVEWHMKKKIVTVEGVELLEATPRLTKPRASIVSVGDRALSVTTLSKTELSFWQSMVKSMNLDMFKDSVYLNITIGLSLGFTSDVAFISIFPMILISCGFNANQAAFFMSAFFASDFAARILLSVLSVFCRIKNRYYFLAASFLLVLFRSALFFNGSFSWTLFVVCALGFLRCFIQTPLPLVIAEEYSHNFSTAFSLFMVVCGVVSLIFGPLMSAVKAITRSNAMVVHLLSLAYLICGISWSAELALRRKK